MDIKQKRKFKLIPDNETRDLLFGIIVFLFLGFLVIHSLGIPKTGVVGKAGTLVDARFFPVIFCGIGCACGLALIIINFLKIRQKKAQKEVVEVNEETKTSENNEIHWGMALVLFSVAWLFVYIFLISILGMVTSSILYLFIQIMAFSKKERRRTVKYIIMVAIISIVVPLIMYFPFRYVFEIIFPRGILL